MAKTTDAHNRFDVFTGDNKPKKIDKWPDAPPWRQFRGIPVERVPRGKRDAKAEEAPRPRAPFRIDPDEIDAVNVALHLRRPLLITGKPGVGKSSLIYAVAEELQLGPVLVWPINTRSTLESGLYRYDAIGRLQESNLGGGAGDAVKSGHIDDTLGKFVTLGPLGTAFLPVRRPRALLIDEIDKSDIDLPNDLLNIFEEGSFEIPVLSRVAEKDPVVRVRTFDGDDVVPVTGGRISVREFPFVVMTSNGERDFPQPFLRRCIRLQIDPPTYGKLARIVEAHFPGIAPEDAAAIIDDFLKRSQNSDMATDQLLNAVFLATGVKPDWSDEKSKALRERVLQPLSSHGNR